MLKKIVLLLAATACLVVFAGPAHAAEDAYGDESAEDTSYWGLGARFSWKNLKNPILVYNDENNPGIPSLDYGNQNFAGTVLWGLSEQLVLSLSLEVGFWNHYIWPNTSTGTSDAVNVNFLTVGAMVGAKYYLTPPESRSVRLYLYGAVGGYLSKAMNSADVKTVQLQVLDNARATYASTSDADCQTTITSGLCKQDGSGKVELDDYLIYVENQPEFANAVEADTFSQDKFDAEVETVSKLASPIVVQLAVGAEFFAGKNFSVGADIIGLRAEIAWADVGRIEQTFPGDPWTGNQRYINLYLYSALTMSFNLTGEDEAPMAHAAPAAGEAAAGQPATGWTGGGGWTAGPAAPTSTSPKVEPSAPAAPGSAITVPASGDEPPPPPPASAE